MRIFSIWLSNKFITEKRIVKFSHCHASTTVPTNTHQVGIRANVMVDRIYVYGKHYLEPSELIKADGFSVVDILEAPKTSGLHLDTYTSAITDMMQSCHTNC